MTSEGGFGPAETASATVQHLARVSAATSDTEVPATSPEHYYLKVAGATSDVTDANF